MQGAEQAGGWVHAGGCASRWVGAWIGITLDRYIIEIENFRSIVISFQGFGDGWNQNEFLK